jgi:hypothetical protein
VSDALVAPGLLPAERGRLAELEQVVERGLQTFVEVGLALTEIRDSRLYRVKYAYLGADRARFVQVFERFGAVVERAAA